MFRGICVSVPVLYDQSEEADIPAFLNEVHLCFKRWWSRLTLVMLALKCRHWAPEKNTSRPAGQVDPVIRLVWVLLCFQ